MSSADIIAELQPLFAEELDLPSIQLSRETKATDVSNWDSLAHINLVAAVERRYKIKFALGELQDMKNVGDLVDLILKKTGR